MAKKHQRTKAAKLTRKKSDWVKTMLLEVGEAADKNNADLFGLDGEPDWVMRAWLEVIKIVFPSGVPTTAEELGPKFLGEMLGRQLALVNLFSGEIPPGSETQAEIDRVMAAASKRPPPKNVVAIEKDLSTKFAAVQQAIPLASAAAKAASHQDHLLFQQGLARGLEIQPDELATSRTFERHTRTYFVLALQWRGWMQCRSLKHVYQILCAAGGEPMIGSFKTFEKVCKKIGFKLRARGRPAGVK